MNKSIVFRLYPNNIQLSKIEQNFFNVCVAHNISLSFWQNELKTGKSCDLRTLSSNLTAAKQSEEYSFLKKADSIALQQELKDLLQAIGEFNSGTRGYPRFKTADSARQSYRTVNINNSIRIEGNKIRLPKIGMVKISHQRETGTIKNVTVIRSAERKYYVSVCCEFPDREMPELPDSHMVVGDFKPTPDEKELRQINQAQKKLSRMVEGSSNYKKQEEHLAHLRIRQSNRQRDAMYKEAKRIVENNRYITLLPPLNSEWRTILEAKAKEYGVIIIES